MIFGHEGLPGSGKSLEAMVHVVNSLLSGRTVVTNISGIDHRAISEHLAIPLPTVQQLLICLEAPDELDEDAKVAWVKGQFFANRHHDCLWIWDEINQFWPPDRQPLSADWAKFVTEHRHLGIDILIMGQDLTELHQTWRKRLQRYTRFTKLDMMGKDDQYHWASYSSAGRLRFKQTASGKKPYNKDFFGFYKSHDDGTANVANYQDKRFSVFQAKHKALGWGLSIAIAVSVAYLWNFFQPGDQDLKAAVQDAPKTEHAVTPAVSAPVQPQVVVAAAPAKAEEPKEPPPIDYLDKLAQQYDLRLSAILDRKNPQPEQAAFEFVMDVLDPGYRVKERFRRIDVVSLGWTVERKDYGVLISKGGKSYVVRPWPLDNFGKAPERQLSQLGQMPVATGKP
ncbi:zonular occludens toxin domain-containing protein [Pseudomonas aeruginosa]|uniref:zonular occludens toxin domain-containing protein n=1 Tax=Pseudomonas aeruginosa TaxID=287 RepID=UPI0008A956FF|nr:zonular occludens toxin domain-containing protein [Pseudomonas aeruginosa]MCM8577084.1 zonular occludens toxin domain-containing protein [Pseudomonas aeruginosa]MCS8337863.1 zonular occludens toxin domain-containing protein [Pseudomonas aeruginosa]MCS8337873.1 zonular occludens toxin domain-containing protein [Pseudomonas aeruginosa]MCS8845963.1 zonular occludens toxin domain-containing protein [Pseudomonas aeruginosa]MCS8845973.1 zonular occludens toxin domain-containing protein [Pseudomon